MKPVRVTAKVAARWLVRRPANAHKGSSGRVLVVAGARGMAGAAVLASSAAVRSGAGLVRLAIVASQQRAAVIRAPLEITTHALTEDRTGHIAAASVAEIRRLMKEFKPTVVAVGPGLGVNAALRRLLAFLLWKSDTPVVADADALNTLATMRSSKRFRAPAVLTPHAGELARLLNISTDQVLKNGAMSVRRAAERFGCVCILKGPRTLTTDAKSIYENTTGNAAMASGGMGDVLTGLVASTWAQRVASPLTSTAFAVFLHGLCADVAVSSFPERTLLASDLIEALPETYRKIWRFV
jgi:NAD(P)H-hydrate epimerase